MKIKPWAYILVLIIICVFSMPSGIFGEVIYHSPDGSVISKDEYNNINKERAKRLQLPELSKNLSNEPSKNWPNQKARPGSAMWDDSRSKPIYYSTVIRHSSEPDIKTAVKPTTQGFDSIGNPTDDLIFYDCKGRPLYNSKGNRLIWDQDPCGNSTQASYYTGYYDCVTIKKDELIAQNPINPEIKGAYQRVFAEAKGFCNKIYPGGKRDFYKEMLKAKNRKK